MTIFLDIASGACGGWRNTAIKYDREARKEIAHSFTHIYIMFNVSPNHIFFFIKRNATQIINIFTNLLKFCIKFNFQYGL